MSAQETGNANQFCHRIQVIPFAAGLALALILGYVLCVAAALALPDLALAHGWIVLFSLEPIGSSQNWIQGIVGSLWFGLLFGVVTAVTYNLLARRR